MTQITTALMALLAVIPVHRNPLKVRAPGATERVERVYAAIDAATDDPNLRVELRNVCARESFCGAFGDPEIHELKSRPEWARKTGARWHASGVRKGHLDPLECPEHDLGDEPADWYNRGHFALVASSAFRYFDECLPPSALDDPFISAKAYVANADRLCREQRRCTCEERAPVFFGLGLWNKRTPWRKMTTLARQCGPPTWTRRFGAAVSTAYGFIPRQLARALKLTRSACYRFIMGTR